MAAVLRVNLIIAGGWGWPGSSQTYVGGVTNLSAVKQIAACLVVGLVLAGCGSATGDSIAFDSDRDGDYEIFVMNADGTEVRQLTDNDHDDEFAQWSPDGDSIAFQSDRDGDLEIFVMNADGTEVRQLTDNDDDDGFAQWSPDGDSIAFTSSRYGDFEIFVMNADGTSVFSTGQTGWADDWGGPAD